MRQEDLAAAAGMKQPRVSAMERPGATNFNLETLIRLAAAFKVGLIVRFASHSEMLEWENDFSQDAFDIVTLDRDSEFVSEERPASQPNIASTLGDGIITICIAPQHVARTTTAWVDRPSGFVPQSQRAQNYVVQGG